MYRLFAVLAALACLSASAATITSATCTSSVRTGCVLVPLGNYPNVGSVSVQVAGTWSATLVFEGSNDDVTYEALSARRASTREYVTQATANGIWTVDTAGLVYFRVRATSYTSGTAVVNVQVSTAPAYPPVAVDAPDGGLYVTVGAQRVAVEATGPGGAPVETSLDEATRTSLGPAACTLLRSDDWVNLSSNAASPVPQNLPDGGPGSLEGRTEILIVNASSTANVSCGPRTTDGGLPEWGVRGAPIFTNGGSATFQARDNERIYCRAHTGTNVPVAPVEASCAR